MEILISNKRKVSEIQKEFSKEYPFLRLEFFNQNHQKGLRGPKRHPFSTDVQIGDCRNMSQDGNIDIFPQMTVAQLEDTLKKQFGLSAQVFRKSGSVWLETSITDGWSLEEQNKQGEELSRKDISQPRENDYHEQP